MLNQDYNKIDLFLNKFKKFVYKNDETKKTIQAVVLNEINFDLDINSLKLKNGFIYIKASPLVRGELMIHKKQILDSIKKIQPELVFFDIK